MPVNLLQIQERCFMKYFSSVIHRVESFGITDSRFIYCICIYKNAFLFYFQCSVIARTLKEITSCCVEMGGGRAIHMHSCNNILCETGREQGMQANR